MVNNTPTERWKWLDILKGIGIMLIMISHASYKIPYLDIYLWACYLPLFFMASGYTFKLRPNLQNVIKKKAKRLLYPYFIYGCIFTFLHSLISHGDTSITRWIGILYARLNLYAYPMEQNVSFLVDGPLWFLPALLLTYLLTYVYVSLSYRWKRGYLAFSLIFTYLCTFLPIYLPWCIDEVFMASLFVIFVYELKEKEYLLKPNLKLLFCLVLVYIFLVTINGGTNMAFRIYGNLGALSIILFFLIGIVGTLMWYCISKKIESTFIGNILAMIGRLSLRLMCIHLPLFQIMTATLKSDNRFLIIILNISASIIFAILIEKVCIKYKKQIPILTYL